MQQGLRFQRRKWNTLLACATIIMTPAHAFAETRLATPSEATLCLSLQKALKLAANKAPTVLTAEGREEEAAANLKEAKGLFLPRINAFNRAGVGDTSIVDSGVSNQIGLQASQRIFDFGDAKYARRSASYFHQASQDEIQAEFLQVAFETGLAFLDTLEAQEQLKITSRRQEYFTQHLAAIDSLLEKGAATRTERASVAAQLAEANGLVLELELAQASAATRIRINTESHVPVCANTLEATMLLETQLSNYQDQEQVIKIAIANNPSISALKNRAAAQTASKARQKRARLPVVAVTATGAYSSLGGFNNFEFDQRVGINLSVPLYAGNAISASTQRARGQETIARGQALNAQRDLRRDISISYRTIASLEQQYLTRQDVETNTQLQFEAANIEQAAGSITLRDLIEIRLEYEQAGLQTVRLKYQLARQRLNLLTMIAALPVEY